MVIAHDVGEEDGAVIDAGDGEQGATTSAKATLLVSSSWLAASVPLPMIGTEPSPGEREGVEEGDGEGGVLSAAIGAVG